MRSLKEQMEQILDKIVNYGIKDTRISGVWTVGSFATGNYDDFSDIDIYFLVPDELYSEVFNQRIQIAENFGRILSTFEVEWDNCDLLGVIYDNPFEVDFCFTRPDQIEAFAPFNVLYDKTGNIHKLLSLSLQKYQRESSDFSIDDLQTQFQFFGYNLLQSINKLGRGDLWSAIKHVEIMRIRIVKLIGFRENEDISEEFAKLESLLREREKIQLSQTLCSYDPISIIQAIKKCSEMFEKVALDLYDSKSIEYNFELYEILLQRLETINIKQ